jgi:phage replication O-like protein O
MAINKPNFTQIPNDILDNYMYQVSGAKLKVLLKICRNTFGWNDKPKDKISLTQLQESTGLCRQSTIDAIKELTKLDLINCKTGKGKINEYYIKIIEPVQKIDQTSPENRPALVQKIDIQKKDKEIIQKKKEAVKDTALFTHIKDYFTKNNPSYYHDSKQAKFINIIITRGKEKEKIFAAFAKFQKIINENQDIDFWKNAPITPAGFYSRWEQIDAYKGKSIKKKLNEPSGPHLQRFDKMDQSQFEEPK